MDPLVPNLALFAGKGIGIALRDPGRLVLGDCFEDSASTAWGNYLELMADQAEGLTISRAPITGMPLYWLEAAGGVLLFSHLELIEGLDVALSVDEEYLRYLLSFSNFRTARTGLSGAQELLPGTALILGRGIPATETFWSPWPHARGRVGESDAPMLLEQRIRACVTAWANSRDSIVVELSGGLDSSIVAAALAQGGHTFSAATIATASPDGDERRFARAVAKSCGIDLVEYVHGDAVLDLTAGPAFLAPRPATYGVLAGIDAALGSATNEMSGGSIFTGIGGDNVFAINRSIMPALDALLSLGPRPRSLAALGDCARLCNATVWRAARAVWRQWRAGRDADWPRDDGYCVRTMLPDEPLARPWDEVVDDLPVGKIRHVQSILRIGDFLDRPGRWYGRDVVAPLLSQPLVELCLAIPSWAWVAGGRDRAVARAAFADHLPGIVAWRRNKGRLETMCAEAFLAQRRALARILLEGRLAREGLIDRDRVEAYLARERIEGDYDYFRLLELADIELWIVSVAGLGAGKFRPVQRAY
ncbi:asparagine synthetase B family protein [uncultured Sphingopyxis sp.]|uniref:asparagine synthase-related protein n=1 Tax=uncultured Sphingopyxis sp. TaxID=310581 RepID=UPI0025930EE7|nr:asparagine synthetase B family protein [uncultured Sphingopyxis sp.]